MGGAGAGHKSARAREARRVNIQKARAARKRAPLPWRSEIESRMIEQLVWQWWMEGGGPSTPGYGAASKWSVLSGEKRQQQAPHGHPATFSAQAACRGQAGCVRDDRLGSPRIIARAQNKPWSRVRVARLLGVSHTWVNKLAKRIEADPERMRRKMRAFAPANLEKLERAREETQRQRELGRLRGPIRWRRVKVTFRGKKMAEAVPTRAEMRRREVIRERGCDVQRDSASRTGGATQVRPAPTRASAMHVSYQELPTWAKGLVPAGDAGAGRRMDMRMPVSKSTPRPVPFAFRRRR